MPCGRTGTAAGHPRRKGGGGRAVSAERHPDHTWGRVRTDFSVKQGLEVSCTLSPCVSSRVVHITQLWFYFSAEVPPSNLSFLLGSPRSRDSPGFVPEASAYREMYSTTKGETLVPTWDKLGEQPPAQITEHHGLGRKQQKYIVSPFGKLGI